MAKRSKKQKTADIIFAPLLTVVIGLGLIFAAKPVLSHLSSRTDSTPEETAETTAETVTETTTVTTTTTTTTTTRFPGAASATTETVTVDDPALLIARNAVLIKVSPEGNEIIAQKEPDAQIYPASMTKLMTLVTYLELMGEPSDEDTVIMDGAVIAAQQARMAHVEGFQPGETCRIKDLLYATMLPSAADAAVMLAVHAAGSEDAFVEKMNALAQEMGLTHSVFYNCTGLNDERHLSSVSDIARVLEYAVSIPTAREILSTRSYTTTSTPEHPDGISFSSTTLTRMVGDELSGLPVPLQLKGGKTGYTDPAGQCLATWAESADGQMYLCVIAGSTTREPLDAMMDTLTLYQLTCKPLEGLQRITVSEENLPDYVHY